MLKYICFFCLILKCVWVETEFWYHQPNTDNPQARSKKGGEMGYGMYLPSGGAGSCSLVAWSMIVPERTVINPQSSEAMLLTSWPDQSCRNYMVTNILSLQVLGNCKQQYYIYRQKRIPEDESVIHLEHYGTGNDGQSCKHYIIHRRNNCCIECIQCLEHKTLLTWEW